MMGVDRISLYPPRYRLHPFLFYNTSLKNWVHTISIDRIHFHLDLQHRARDIDFATKRVRVTPEKGSNPRILPISHTLISMLNGLPRETEYIFRKGMYHHFSEGFRRHRKKIAFKLGEPDIKRITFKSLRHFKGTMEYQKTKDILHMKRILGHKNINNTLIYTHLIDFGEDEWISKVARDADEACELVEAGFEFVCSTPDDFIVFRKRK